MFSEDLSRVVLIRKTKPDWQANKLNGVGGKVEDTEFGPYAAHAAMVREFREETGLETRGSLWHCFARLDFPEATVFCLATLSADIDDVRTTTDEAVGIYRVDSVGRDPWFAEVPHMPNLRWLIPMARQSARFLNNEYVITARRLS